MIPPEVQHDRTEARKNAVYPGARILRRSAARKAYVNGSGCLQWFYPLSEANDLGLATYIEKRRGTDTERPWATQSHPGVSLYMLVLRGSGRMFLGGGDVTFYEEAYDYSEGDLVVVPRGIPYRHEGEWDAVAFQARTSTSGVVAGTNRFPHPVIGHDRPHRPTARERDALPEPGTVYLVDPLFERGVRQARVAPIPFLLPDVLDSGPDLHNDEHDPTATELLQAVTPVDELTTDDRNVGEARRNPGVLGARVIHRSDAPVVFNPAGQNRHWSYPLGWTDDLAIFIGATHTSSSDATRPADSHSHFDIEEYKYIVKGSGTSAFGNLDDSFETETYAFAVGDLVITPRGVPHRDAGDYTAIYFHTKASAFGRFPGTVQMPHPAYIYEQPPRPTQAERKLQYPPGTYIVMDSRETLNRFQPDPILKLERTHMADDSLTVLRPDLFPDLEK